MILWQTYCKLQRKLKCRVYHFKSLWCYKYVYISDLGTVRYGIYSDHPHYEVHIKLGQSYSFDKRKLSGREACYIRKENTSKCPPCPRIRFTYTVQNNIEANRPLESFPRKHTWIVLWHLSFKKGKQKKQFRYLLYTQALVLHMYHWRNSTYVWF